MKATITLPELEQQLLEREARFSDLTVPAGAIHIESERGDLVVRGEPHPLQDHVLTLLGPKLGIPAAYLRRCPPDLRARNVNHWMDSLGSKDFFVRLDGQEVRAVLSTRYQPVSNAELVYHLRDFLPPWSEPEVKVDITPTRMIAQVILEEHRKTMSVGDEIIGGVCIINSEVGFSSVEISRFIHRLVCSNGLVVREKQNGFRRVHLKGRDSLRTDIRKALQRSVDHIPAVLESMAKTQEVPLVDPEKALEDLPRRHGLTEAEHEAVKSAWEEEQGPSLYNLVNAITGAAQDEDLSQDSRLRLQTLAGDLLPA